MFILCNRDLQSPTSFKVINIRGCDECRTRRYVKTFNKDFKIQRRRRQQERQKNKRFKVSVNENFSTLLDFVFIFIFGMPVGPKFYFGRKRKSESAF